MGEILHNTQAIHISWHAWMNVSLSIPFISLYLTSLCPLSIFPSISLPLSPSFRFSASIWWQWSTRAECAACQGQCCAASHAEVTQFILHRQLLKPSICLYGSPPHPLHPATAQRCFTAKAAALSISPVSNTPVSNTLFCVLDRVPSWFYRGFLHNFQIKVSFM